MSVNRKLTRKRKTKDPCAKCRLHRLRCICSLIPRLELRSRISLVIHAKELKRTTNTGCLALHALVNSQMYVRGEGDTRLDLNSLLSPAFESFVLYPAPDALELEALTKVARPVQLIVADGNWRQANKLNIRHPELAHLPRVKISDRNLAQHFLRKEHFSEGLSTLEAIAIALGTLEGEAVKQSLMALYRAKLDATLAGRPRQFGPAAVLTDA